MAKTRAEIKNAYAKKAYDDLRIQVKKGGKAIIKEYTDKEGKSINGLVNEEVGGSTPLVSSNSRRTLRFAVFCILISCVVNIILDIL